MSVSIVIPVYNEANYLEACLAAIDRQTTRPDEVIVVDNNCTDNTVEIARRRKYVRVIKETRQGTVFARDAGFKAARGDILARIDADTRLPPDWVVKVTRAFKDDPDTDLVTGPPRFYDVPLPWIFNSLQVALYQYFEKLLTGTYVAWGANMAIRRSAWDEVSPLCTERPGIDEDIDLSLWLHKKGCKIRFMSDLPVGASMQRGQTGIKYTVTYLSTWPRDYLLHRMYLRALIVAVLTGIMMVASTLYLLALKLIRPGSRSSRRHRSE